MIPSHGRVLIIDPESDVRRGVASVLESQGISAVTADTGEAGVRTARSQHFDVVLVDPKTPGLAGVDLVRALRDADSHALIIVTSGYATVRAAVDAMRTGVFDYLPKPVRSEELILAVKRAFERVGESIEDAQPDEAGFAGIVSQAPVMQQVFETIRRVASSKATILIEGESGTGKELVARAIHSQSKRCAFPFISVHCSALPASLLESELFGHEKGAFTGAIRMQKGRFELADRGTLLIDEVATLEPRAQVDLLRVLQEREFTRIGGTELIRTEARVIATSNEPLATLVDEGRFRKDLFYRLNVVRIELPPLRERDGDLELLVWHFVNKYALENERVVAEVAPDAMEQLTQWSWPGNVRELENVIEHAVVVGRGGAIRFEDLPEEIRCGSASAMLPPDAPLSNEDDLCLERRLGALEADLMTSALQACGFNRVRAAEQLGISERALRYKIQKYKIPIPHGDGGGE